MGYQIDAVTGSEGECQDIARFLSEFIRDREGPLGDAREQTPELWHTRMRGWWDTNPFCRVDSPKGLVVRTDAGEMVGFYGYIPHNYSYRGKVVPGLIATTSYVRAAHRGAALPLFMKAHRQEIDFHYSDGAPNKAIYPILERFGYQHRDTAKMHLYPVGASLSNPVRWATGLLRVLTNPPAELPEKGKIITNPMEAESCAIFPDEKLRREVSRESLFWYLKSGSKPHYFAGWCDEEGVLQCYLLGFVREKSIVSALAVVDYAFSSEESRVILDRLITRIAGSPAEFQLPDSVSLIAWASCEDELESSAATTREFDPRFFYRLPRSLSEVPRHNLPFEGDHLFQ